MEQFSNILIKHQHIKYNISNTSNTHDKQSKHIKLNIIIKHVKYIIYGIKYTHKTH